MGQQHMSRLLVAEAHSLLVVLRMLGVNCRLAGVMEPGWSSFAHLAMILLQVDCPDGLKPLAPDEGVAAPASHHWCLSSRSWYVLAGTNSSLHQQSCTCTTPLVLVQYTLANVERDEHFIFGWALKTQGSGLWLPSVHTWAPKPQLPTTMLAPQDELLQIT